MNVAELIEKLKALPQDMPVVLWSPYDDNTECRYVDVDPEITYGDVREFRKAVVLR